MSFSEVCIDYDKKIIFQVCTLDLLKIVWKLRKWEISSQLTRKILKILGTYNNIYNVNFAKTDSYRNSAIPNLQRLLNEHEQERNWMLKWWYYLCTSIPHVYISSLWNRILYYHIIIIIITSMFNNRSLLLY